MTGHFVLRPTTLATAVALLAACDKSSDSGGTHDSGKGGDSGASIDADKDGYASTEDCDDTNADVNPGATEVCDEIDNNCVDGIDEGLTTPYYADTDGDTYGAGAAVDACIVPPGYVDNADDCDDTTAATNPGATEACDGIDNNCVDGIDEDVLTSYYADGDGDGFGAGTAVDECAAPAGYVENADDCDDLDADVGSETYYVDSDLDGYGDAYVTTLACVKPWGYVENADDCDDLDDRIYPGAAEVCDDVDNDCNRSIDEDDPGVVDDTTWYSDADNDGYGDDSTATDTCDSPPDWVTTAGDCDDFDAGVGPDAAEVCDDVDNDCDGIVDGLCDYKHDRELGTRSYRQCTDGVWSSWSSDECP